MKSIFVLCGVLGAVTDASECQADENSLLQSRSAVRMIKDHRAADAQAVLKNMRGVANSLLEGSDTTMTADEVNDALDAASNALAELSPAIRQQIENAQQQINDAASAVQVCHAQEQAELRSSLRESAGQRAAAVESCHSALDQLRTDETRQCGIAEDCLCDEARVRTTDQEALCASMTETYEAAFCEHHHVCTIFHQCHAAEAEVFTRLRADVEAEMALTVQEYIAVEQSRCLTGLIMEAMTPPVTPISHAALVACNDVDVSALDIDFPTLPAEPAACPAHEHGDPECARAYTHALADTKCPHQHGDRLFRNPASGSSGITLDECYAQCAATQGCNHFSHGVYNGGNVCMGCTTLANAQTHAGFTAYDMAQVTAGPPFAGRWVDPTGSSGFYGGAVIQLGNECFPENPSHELWQTATYACEEDAGVWNFVETRAAGGRHSHRMEVQADGTLRVTKGSHVWTLHRA